MSLAVDQYNLATFGIDHKTLELTYFNYTNHSAESWWERRVFLHGWWRIQASDPRWAPPYYPALRHLLVKQESTYLTPSSSVLFHLEALPRRQSRSGEPGSLNFTGALMEEAVAAAILYVDPRRTTEVGYLGLLHCVNHLETLERFWGAAQEIVSVLGGRRVVGPVGLAPGLPMGALQNYFHVNPPLHTPYNPPYMPELLESLFEPVAESELYHYTLPASVMVTPAVAQVEPFDPARLAGDLLPLFLAALVHDEELGAPSASEVKFMLNWLRIAPFHAMLAMVGGEPTGFVLLQPDAAPFFRQARGGRNLAARGWLAWRRRQAVRSGRLLYGAVLPAWRGQGIGAQLWGQAHLLAQQQGWQSLTVGPLCRTSLAVRFLARRGAEPRQRYVVYGAEL